MRVVISDDHPVVLIGLKTSLREYGQGLDVVGEANDGQSLLDVLARVPCDLLITDFAMPADVEGYDGLALLRRVRESHPALPILVLTMLRNPALVQNIIGLGVRAVVDKMAMARELMLAIDTIRGGRSYLSERMRRQIEGMYPTGEEPPVSRREVEVIRLVAQGMTVSEIARRLERSVKTISQQKRDAMRKLNLTSDKQLYDYVRQIGLI